MPSSISFSHHGLLLCNLFVSAAYATLPYTPSYIFPSNRSNSSLAYVLQPNADQDAIEFLSLDLSNFNPASPQSTVLYHSVPFAANNDGAFIPILNTNGVINVIQGNCQGSQGAPLVWTFHADQDSHSGNGTWKSLPAEQPSTNGSNLGYLASGFAFASSNDTSADLYTFGGMCPSTDSTLADWVSAANYSQSMTLLAPNNSSQPSSYGIEDITPTSPPVAEAGYTVTELQRVSSTTSTGRNVQEGEFLFIGGHTHNAFINMSTIALFSLPQAGWTYIPVDLDDGSPRTDLAVRDTQVEPRSGHTAVISSDGSRIVIFGGWVGDTNTPANPQLLVLEVGEDYGGSGEWTWTVPQPIGSGPSQDSGIFGHAATMLDGDVMMISGGYTISTASTNSKRDSSTFETNSQVHLYNVTSNAWTSTYTQPNSQNAGSGQGTGSALDSSGEKAGLGIGVSAAAIAVIGVAYVVWSRKRWNHRRHRDKELRKLAFGAERSNIWSDQGIESSYRNPEDDSVRNSILENLYSSGQSHHYSAVPGPGTQGPIPEAERTGLLYEVPSPTRGLRRNLTGRPQRVQSAGWYDEARTGYGAGSIHPIDERDEYETSPEAEERETGRQTPRMTELSDPFADPGSPSRVPLITFPESPVMKQQGSDSMSVRSEGARSASPEKSERTNSSLSEASISNLSDTSIQRSHIGSIRGRHLLQSAIPILEPSNHETTAASGRNSPEKSPGRAERLESDSVRWPFDRSGTVDSFSTSSSRRKQSHLEGETLLGSAPEWSTPPESPTRSLESEHKRGGSTWMGSLRKTLSNAKKAATSMHSNTSDNNNNNAAAASEKAPSPEPGPSTARRPSNASIAHLQRRQGPRDWAIDGRQSRSSVMSLSHTDDDDPFDDEDDDWDVEAAVEGRLVQITYTVPKERLRVVNAGVADRVTVDDESDKESRASVG
ncbi:uncharacterized protein TRUGW13939_03349 [Talaromyces rugulosus]|uniref:Uncharacterized protein n=1 Tax=Talaromyces rugulosus TaxID=121627 RepID=A0A7H8QQT2_TALRU|nr:uncharacterized protein TRUGW13939_03349 [Talaromyces rugulosus]QKX56248.1 hypothetical protein TRUGW13939_03349 [Talaromyces rugulosus]